jgi:hypothetical protein
MGFHECVELIQESCAAFGANDWRFLYSPMATFAPATRLAFVGLNPSEVGGNEPFGPIPSVEAGNAYRVECWAGVPGAFRCNALQHQVRRLFECLAGVNFGNGNPDVLMDETLTLNYCPFRSAIWHGLQNQEQALAFSDRLWSLICGCITPSVIICMTHEPFARLGGILHDEQNFIDEMPQETGLLGWGHVTYSIARLHRAEQQVLLVRFPHLSWCKIFSREECSEPLRPIIREIAERITPP